MQLKILREAGYHDALYGMSLSYGKPIEAMVNVSQRLASKDGGHNKFLESIVVWVSVIAPRYWWQEFDTYRVGVTKQSASTMHTITKRRIEQTDFERIIDSRTLDRLNKLIADGDFFQVKSELPEGFLQQRVVCLNYKVLRHIFRQRITHRLPEWQFFINEILQSCEHPEFLEDAKRIKNQST